MLPRMTGYGSAPSGSTRTRGRWWRFIGPLLLVLQTALPAVAADRLLERSYWVHASLASDTRRGYWGTEFPEAVAPAEHEIAHAARLLTHDYAANRLYLIYHREIPLAAAETAFAAWRKHVPTTVELIPTLVLRSYDRPQTEVFTSNELRRLAGFFRADLHSTNCAVYDIYKGRDQGPGLAVLAQAYPAGLIRVGIQPDETLAAPFTAAVADTWSAFCHATKHEDWRRDAAGAPALQQWVAYRNQGTVRVAWDLIVVGWDYTATEQGRYPGYDDAARNLPLPAGRNELAAAEIRRVARPGVFAGFSSDLFILHVNSRHPARDGEKGAFYETLKRGEPYRGFFAAPLREVVEQFRPLAALAGKGTSGTMDTSQPEDPRR